MSAFSENCEGISGTSSFDKIYKLLLFDFDGTIADTRSIAHQILNEMSEEFSFRTLPLDQIDKVRNMGIQEFISYLGISSWRIPIIAQRGLRLLNQRIAQVRPISGIPELLASLHAHGHQIGMLTSNSQENVDAFLTRHKLHYFHFIRTSSKLLGKSREIRKLLKKWKMMPSDVLYIGDEIRDIDAAHETGIKIAAVTWGYNTASVLFSRSPHYLIFSPEKLFEIVESKR